MKRLRASTSAVRVVRRSVVTALLGALMSVSLLTPAPALAQETAGRTQFGQQKLILHIESVGIDPISVRPLVRPSIPKDAVLLDSADFLRLMREKGQSEPFGNAYSSNAEKTALQERMRAAAVELKADGVVLVLMISTPKRRAVRLVVQYASEDQPSLDRLVELDPTPATDAAKIDAALRPVLEEFRAPAPTPPPPPPETTPPTAALKPESPATSEVKKTKPFPWSLSVGLNAHLDAYALFGPGVTGYERSDGSGLTSGADVQRVRPRVSGGFGERFYYMFQLDFGGSNSTGPNQTFAFRGGSSHAWIAYRQSDALNIRFGQFPQPFTFENQRPNMMLDFMDQSRVLALAAPNAIDTGLMVFGLPGRFGYGVGISNGEGRNRVPIDAHGEATERASVSFNKDGDNRLRIGISGRQGFVDPTRVFGEAPNNAFTTFRGYQFWTPNYTYNGGVAPGASAVPVPISVIPSGSQHAYAADLVAELGDFSVQAEGAYIHFDTREVARSAPDVENTQRAGSMSGAVYYVTLGYWLFGATKPLKTLRWEQKIFQLGIPREEEPFQPSLLLLARWQEMFLSYDSTSRSPFGTERGLIDNFTSRLRTDILSLNATTWLSTRFSIMAEWDMYLFPGSPIAGTRGAIDNQALAPGAVIPGQRGTRAPVDVPFLPVAVESYFRPPHPDARSYNEVSLRLRVQF